MWPNYIPVLTWELYPRAKEVFLVRDFRDMARSILAFDARRGFAGFGRPEGARDEEYMREVLADMARDLHRSWQTRSDRAHLIRYEDLVLDTESTCARLLEYLEIDASPETLTVSSSMARSRCCAFRAASTRRPRFKRIARCPTRARVWGAGAVRPMTSSAGSAGGLRRGAEGLRVSRPEPQPPSLNGHRVTSAASCSRRRSSR